MKNHLNVLFAGALAVAICTGFTACNDAGDDWLKSRPEGEIAVVSLSDEDTAAISDYLKRIHVSHFEIPDSSEWERYSGDFAMINSMDELLTVDTAGNPIERPSIDFETHTLVTGWFCSVHSGIYPAWQGVLPGAETTTLNLVLGDLGKERDYFVTAAVVTAERFWGLYPKLPASPGEINITYKEY